MRPTANRPVLSFEQRCDTCNHIRDCNLFVQYLSTCQLCRRRAERIRDGLIDYEQLQVSGSKSAERQHLNARARLQKWRDQRQAELTAEGILWGDAYRVLEAEQPAMMDRFGL